MSSRAWLCWRGMKMKWNVWLGPLQGTYWRHVAETRVSGFGKVCIKLQCHQMHGKNVVQIRKRINLCLSVCIYDYYCLFHSGWRRRLWVCYRGELSHTRCQACCVAPGTRSESHPALYTWLISALLLYDLTPCSPCVSAASGLGELRQQHLYLQGRGWWLGVPGHLAGTHFHSVEFVLRCDRTETGLLQWRSHSQDLEGVSKWKCTGWVSAVSVEVGDINLDIELRIK